MGGKDGSSIRAVIFDAGNTLVFLDPERFTRLLGASGVEASPERFWDAERTARRALLSRIGPGTTGMEPEIWQEYFTTLYRESGVPPTSVAQVTERLRATHERSHLWTHVESGTRDALLALEARGYRLAVVSNADGRVEALLRDVGLTAHFEFVLDSGVVGIEKPDPRIFHLAAERLDVPPAQCLYVGDLYEVDVLGAQRAGMEAILIDRYDLHAGETVRRVSTVGELPEYLENRGFLAS